jgi:hypothetical protein
VNWPDQIDKRMGTEEWLDSFVPILLSNRISGLPVPASPMSGRHREFWSAAEAAEGKGDNRRDECLRISRPLAIAMIGLVKDRG